MRTTSIATATAGLSASATGTRSKDPEPSITFEDQESNGQSVVVQRAQTNADAWLIIRDAESSDARGRYPEKLEAGTVNEDLTVMLDEPLSQTTELSARLYHADEGNRLAISSARVFVNEEMGARGMSPTLIEADEAAGFNYPYYLYAPAQSSDAGTVPFMVEPTNSGTTSDDFEVHRQRGEQTVLRGIGRQIVDGVKAPLIVPIFPRPRSSPVDTQHYIHALDRKTLAIDDGPLERVDQQLLAMVEDAKTRLADQDIDVMDSIMLTGFSASGNFVERFTALHPEKVHSVSAGGLNGMPILPIEEAKGYTLDYHVGVADLEELIGKPFNLEAFRDVDQLLYMGEFDGHDTIPYDDAWSDELREIALAVYGENIQRDRFPYAKAVYEDVDAQAVFRVYDDIGHRPPDVNELIQFHRQSIEGAGFETLRSEFGGDVPNLNAYIEYAPQTPEPGEQVAFDATRSEVANHSITGYEWQFSGGETKTGDVVTYTFNQQGGHNVRLTVTDDANNTYETVSQVVVEGDSVDSTGNTTADSTTASQSSATTTSYTGGEATSADTTMQDRDSGTTSGSLPGFGITTGIAALASAGYFLHRRTIGGRSE